MFLQENRIAPLNFQIKSPGTEFVAVLSGNKGEKLVAGAEADGKVMLDSTAWYTLLEANKGDSLAVTIYARQQDGRWLTHPSYAIHVAHEPIDRYLSYRLIEPGYELYRQLGLYQRDLHTFNVQPIYENNRSFNEKDNHCINCHNYQNYDTQRMPRREVQHEKRLRALLHRISFLASHAQLDCLLLQQNRTGFPR